MKLLKTLEDFKSHVGKRVYRDDSGCSCVYCKDIVESGIIVHDDTHAEYLFDMQNDFAAEGTFLNYRDTKND